VGGISEMEFAWLNAGGSSLTEKITQNLKNPKTILSSENIMQHLARQQQFMAGNQNVIENSIRVKITCPYRKYIHL
jgi:hypothetical protein